MDHPENSEIKIPTILTCKTEISKCGRVGLKTVYTNVDRLVLNDKELKLGDCIEVKLDSQNKNQRI